MSNSCACVSGSAEGRLTTVMAEADALAAELPRERLPDLFGGLERVRRVAELRLTEHGVTGKLVPDDDLLLVPEVAKKLKVTTQTVYRWAKSKLRFAVVDVGAGSLRFDPRKIQKFIESSRRG